MMRYRHVQDVENRRDDYTTKSRLMTVTIAIVLSLGISFGCTEQPDTPVEVIESTVKVDFEFLDPVAANLLQNVFLDPFDYESRMRISAWYSSEGSYSTLASFFRDTGAFVRSGSTPLFVDEEGPDDGIVCNVYEGPLQIVKEQERTARAVAEELRELAYSNSADASECFVIASEALNKNGMHCALLIEWSRIALSVSLASPETSRALDEEAALRILVTLASQGFLSPDLSNEGRVWLDVSEYFSARGDYPSGYEALQRAVWLSDRDGTHLPLDSVYLKNQIERLRQLAVRR